MATDDWDDPVIVRKTVLHVQAFLSVSRAGAQALFHLHPRGVQVAPLISTQTHDCISVCPGANGNEAEETVMHPGNSPISLIQFQIATADFSKCRFLGTQVPQGSQTRST